MHSVLITGASGFFGAAIVRQFEAADLSVRTTGLEDEPPASLPDYHPADLADAASLGNLVRGVDCIVHAAGLAHRFRPSPDDEARFTEVNVAATENLARAAITAGVAHFVLISSVSVYGVHGEGPCDETMPCSPEGPYARSKYEAEQRLRQLSDESDLRATILRPATLYGEGDPGNVARLLRTIDAGRFVWIGNGQNLKSLIYREDAARACVLAADRNSRDQLEVYNVTGPPCRMRDVVEGLAEALNRRLPRWRVPASMARLGASVGRRLGPNGGRLARIHGVITKWLADDVYDGRKIEQELGFRAQMPLAEGLRKEVDWYRHLDHIASWKRIQ